MLKKNHHRIIVFRMGFFFSSFNFDEKKNGELVERVVFLTTLSTILYTNQNGSVYLSTHIYENPN